jgi:hypothetical protein
VHEREINPMSNPSTSQPGGGFWSYDNKDASKPNNVPAETQVRNPGTGETGRADGNGGIFKNPK